MLHFLRRLNINDNAKGFAEAFVGVMQPKSPECIYLHAQEFSSISEIVRSVSHFASLVELVLEEDQRKDTEPSILSEDTSLRAITPLRSLTQLQVLQLALRSLSLGDSALCLIAEIFPHIKCLYLHTYDPANNRSTKFTLSGLQGLALKCTSLESLRLPSLDVSSGLPVALPSISISQPSNLQTLRVDSSTPFDPTVLAAILKRLFPNLKKIQGRDARAWSRVLSLINVTELNRSCVRGDVHDDWNEVGSDEDGSDKQVTNNDW
ncbi:hypothetical protein HGRIS_011199 [Hohenbuehelia grisea]|uniref:Uncharacterized protein n=1 Tax=Hohenbuehelia grisea TaxID=104357 RepID=A0ABR3JUF7_9AGAR